jgi:arylsulfatase A-like enzyme
MIAALAAAAPGCGKDAASKGTNEVDPKAGSAEPEPGSGSAAGKAGKTPKRAAARGPERVAYSLADNRLAAHVQRNGGLVVVHGSVGIDKYARFGKGGSSWKREEAEGKKVGTWNEGPIARLVVPLTAAQVAGTPKVWLRAHNGEQRIVELRFNGTKVNATLPAGWATTEVTAPAGSLTEGENEVVVYLGKGGPTKFEWLQVGGTAAADEAPKVHDGATGSLVLADGGGLAWYVLLPDKALVTADLADGSCKIAVKATGEDGKAIDGTLEGLGSAVDLAALGGKAARLELTASGCAQAQLANAALVVPGAAPAAAARGAAPKYIVMFIMDSLRADRVKPFNPKARPDAPTWEELAKTSALFLQNYVQGNESRVSHASIWSSLYSINHGLTVSNEINIEKKWTTVDEVAKSAKLYTAGVSANGFVDPVKRNSGEKWDHFSNHIHKQIGLTGKDILDAGIKVVEGKKDPWFLYLGTIDTHVSWRAKEPWISQYDGGYKGRFEKVFSGDDANKAKKLGITDAEKKHVRALYDSNVSYQDDLLKQLLAKLAEWGIADETMIIITGDHGDEQWEKGRVGHGGSVYDALVHVPLLIHYPPMVPAGVYAPGTEVIDIVPTIADALGVKADDRWQGQSLIPLANGVNADYARMSVSTPSMGMLGARIGKWKMVASGGGAVEVYDVAADPEETKDLAGKAHIGTRLVADALWQLRGHNAEWKKSVWGNPANVTAEYAKALGE